MEHLIIFFLLLNLHCQSTSSSSLVASSTSAKSCPKDETIALLQLKDEFSYDESASIDCKSPRSKMFSWEVGTDCCLWDGITCDNVTSQVIGLDLSCSGLGGNFTSNNSIFHLSNLQSLNLAFNNFNHSEIPSEFGSFAKLTYLNLSTTWFAVPIPFEISHLSKLVTLDLSQNEPLRLETPTVKMMAQNLNQVSEIFLDYIDMSSVSLNSLVNLSSSLTALSLVLCHLQGHFPETIFHFPNLEFLNLELNNDLYGLLPKSNWSSPLELLLLSSTSFSGELPDSIGNLNSLMVLELGNCNFTGSIPATLESLEQLVRMDLSNNNWTGQIPDVFENLSNLAYLSSSSNNFSGMLPSSIFNLTKLYWLDLSQNYLHGSLPDQICGLIRLTKLDSSYNLLTDIIPDCVYGLPSLVWFSLSFNQLTGELGKFQSKSLLEITLENNKIYGSSPPSVFELMNLTNFHVPSNNLSGLVDLNMFSKLKNLWGLDLSDSHLSVITSNASSNSTWPQFYRLALSSCNISEFPDFLRTQTELGYLSLSNNQIHGELPKWFSGKGMQYLEYLDLSHNFLTKVNELPINLQYLGLGFNLLHQTLPLLPPSMYILLISNNNLTGEIPLLFCNITTFQIIDLSCNSLSGTIPQCLANFSSELSMLNLGNKNLHGTIPGSFREGNKLRNLNLNGNQLKGLLPRSLVNCKMFYTLIIYDISN